MKTIRIAASALLAGVVLTACGQQGQTTQPNREAPSVAATSDQPTPPTPTPAPSASGNPGDLPVPSRPPAAGGTPGATKPAAGPTTVTGTVTAGVEPNCLLIDGYLLVGGPRDVLRPGARVNVTGTVQPGMMTTCQQGTPFVVETARPA